MAPDEQDDLRARVERLESEVESLRRQLDGRRPSRVEPGPPPVQQPFTAATGGSKWEAVEHVPVRPKQPTPPVAATSGEPPLTTAKPKVDAEMAFGSKVLPRAGIVIVLIGILYLVAYAIQTGRITLATQFVGELALCAALLGFGLWKLNAKEDFGQVLVGGGSCGLYLSFAGGHVYKNLYEGEVLVTMFLLLSLANLAFSWWRSSKSFWAIGLVGGLVGASLPLQEDKFVSVLALMGTISASATLLAAVRGWLRAIEVLWLATALMALGVTHEAVDHGVFTLAAAFSVMYAFSFVPVAAHALRFEPTEFDPRGWFGAVASGATALATLSYVRNIDPVPHSVAVVLFSAAVGALAWLVRSKANAGLLSVAAIACATVIAPMGFTALQACVMYAVFGLASSAFAYSRQKGLERSAVMFCASHVAFSIIAYAIAMGSSVVPVGEELTMLAAMGVGIANLAFVAGRMESKMEEAVTVGAGVLYLVLARASFVSFSELGAYSVVFCTSAYAIVLSVVALRAKWQGPAVLALFLTGLSTLVYWSDGMAGGFDAPVGGQIAALALSTVALVLTSLATGRSQNEKRVTSVVTSLLGCFVVVPMVWHALRQPSVGVMSDAAVVVAMCVYAVVLALVSMATKWGGNAIVGMVVAFFAVLAYAGLASGTPEFASNWEQIPLVAALALALALSGQFSSNEDKGRAVARVVSAVIGWYVVSRLIFLVLTLPGVGMVEQAAQQTAWSLYSIGLAVLAVRIKLPALAYVASASVLIAIGAHWIVVLGTDVVVPRGQQLIAVVLASAAVAVCTVGAGKDAAERKVLSVLGAIVGWASMGRALALVLQAMGMAPREAVTPAWSVYAAVVLSLGFVYDAKPLRITALAIFGVTVAKVFLVDLAALEAYIRIIAVMLLGVLLILGGYIYVRRREDAKAS